MNTWMRSIQVILTSTSLKQKMVFDTNKSVSLNIKINGYKYLSTLKDNFTLKISNLTYKEIVTLISGQFYDVEIKAGYMSASTSTIFKGSVIYISNVLNDKKTNEVIILCGNNIVAKFGQGRLNLSLQSGINMYSALSFICKRAGINNPYIDNDFKARIIRESINANQTIGSYLDMFTESNGFVIQSDSTYSNDVSIWNPYRKDSRKIVLDSSKIVLTSGYPTLTSEGLRITLLPTFNFMPGDTIVLDNSVINVGVSSQSEVYENRTYFMDESGQYVIFEIEYILENRGPGFSVNMLCKSKSLISNVSNIGGN